MYRMRARCPYCATWRMASRIIAKLLPPPRPPPRNRSYSSGTPIASIWNSLNSSSLMLHSLGRLRLGVDDPPLPVIHGGGRRQVHGDLHAVGLPGLVALVVAVAALQQEHGRRAVVRVDLLH